MNKIEPGRGFIPPDNNPAFSFEIREETNPDSLYKHIESYLGEYRFQLPIYHYHLQLRNGELVDPFNYESMVDKAERALEKRRSLGLSSQREAAELKGLKFFKENLRPMDTLVWVSPPGEKEDGYGSYGFFFYGFVNNNGDIEMTARRAEMTKEEFEKRDFSRFSKALFEITNDNQFLEMKNDIDFLSSPVILKPREGAVDIEKVIESNFGKIDLERLRFFSEQIKFLKPLIDSFIEAYLREENDSYLTSLFNTIENLALLEDTSHEDFDFRLIPYDKLIKNFGYTPPQVFGSCGSTSSNKSDSLIKRLSLEFPSTSNILEKLGLSSDNEDEYGSLTFHCPVCNGKHERPRGELLTHCPTTGKEIPKC